MKANDSISADVEAQVADMLSQDGYLEPYAPVIRRRLHHINHTHHKLIQDKTSLADVVSGHEYYGLHFINGEWIFREWAPNATRIFIIGEMTDWREDVRYALTRKNDNGDWEVRLPESALQHGGLYRLKIYWPGGSGERIPAYARRVVQDPRLDGSTSAAPAVRARPQPSRRARSTDRGAPNPKRVDFGF